MTEIQANKQNQTLLLPAIGRERERFTLIQYSRLSQLQWDNMFGCLLHRVNYLPGLCLCGSFRR